MVSSDEREHRRRVHSGLEEKLALDRGEEQYAYKPTLTSVVNRKTGVYDGRVVIGKALQCDE